jgi:putative redox protein
LLIHKENPFRERQQHMENIIQAKASIGEIAYSTELDLGGHTFLADEPLEVGGQNKGPTPSRLLCASLASCIAITLRMYADRKKWNPGKIDVRVSLDRSGETPEFTIGLQYEHKMAKEELDRLRIIAGKCPVHKLLHAGNAFRYTD